MKKLLVILAAAMCFAACSKDAEVLIVEDMMFFQPNPLPEEGVVLPVTSMNTPKKSDVTLWVARDVFGAKKHAKQSVKVSVVESLTTAQLGTDFTLDKQEFTFSDKHSTRLPLTIKVLDGASGKKIVLQLVYEYYKECNLESRKADKITITVE